MFSLWFDYICIPSVKTLFDLVVHYKIWLLMDFLFIHALCESNFSRELNIFRICHCLLRYQILKNHCGISLLLNVTCGQDPLRNLYVIWVDTIATHSPFFHLVRCCCKLFETITRLICDVSIAVSWAKIFIIVFLVLGIPPVYSMYSTVPNTLPCRTT